MRIVHVHVRVTPADIEAFKQASIENASQSVKEPGIARFDVLQQADDPARFLLVEVYRTPDAPARHKETAHYQKWRDTVAPMMAEPRASVKFANMGIQLTPPTPTCGVSVSESGAPPTMFLYGEGPIATACSNRRKNSLPRDREVRRLNRKVNSSR